MGDLGARASESEPPCRENWGRERKPSRLSPSWRVRGARWGFRPPISQTDPAETASSPRPRCRAGPPRPGAAGKQRLTGCPSILVELGLTRLHTQHGARPHKRWRRRGPGYLAQILKKTTEWPQDRARGRRVRAGRAARRSSADLAPRFWGGRGDHREAVGRAGPAPHGRNLQGGRPQRESAQPI